MLALVLHGELGDRLYIVKQGEVDVIARGKGEQEVVVATLETMDYFGEIALLRDEARTATVQSRGPVELYSLSRADFRTLLQRSKMLHSAMTGTSETRYLATQNILFLPR